MVGGTTLDFAFPFVAAPNAPKWALQKGLGTTLGFAFPSQMSSAHMTSTKDIRTHNTKCIQLNATTAECTVIPEQTRNMKYKQPRQATLQWPHATLGCMCKQRHTAKGDGTRPPKRSHMYDHYKAMPRQGGTASTTLPPHSDAPLASRVGWLDDDPTSARRAMPASGTLSGVAFASSSPKDFGYPDSREAEATISHVRSPLVALELTGEGVLL